MTTSHCATPFSGEFQFKRNIFKNNTAGNNFRLQLTLTKNNAITNQIVKGNFSAHFKWQTSNTIYIRAIRLSFKVRLRPDIVSVLEIVFMFPGTKFTGMNLNAIGN